MLLPLLTAASLGLSAWAVWPKAKQTVNDVRRARNGLTVLYSDVDPLRFGDLAMDAMDLYDQVAANIGDNDGTLTLVFDLTRFNVYTASAPSGGAVRFMVDDVILPDGTTLERAAAIQNATEAAP